VSYGRREFLAAAAATVAAAATDAKAQEPAPTPSAGMFGLVGSMYATAGQRDTLVAILLEGTGGMPGCLSYIVATDPKDADAIWITEVWDSAASHKASLSLPEVKAAIAGRSRSSHASVRVTSPSPSAASA
jgi:quinol monooxygenase YgiN